MRILEIILIACLSCTFHDQASAGDGDDVHDINSTGEFPSEFLKNWSTLFGHLKPPQASVDGSQGPPTLFGKPFHHNKPGEHGPSAPGHPAIAPPTQPSPPPPPQPLPQPTPPPQQQPPNTAGGHGPPGLPGLPIASCLSPAAGICLAFCGFCLPGHKPKSSEVSKYFAESFRLIENVYRMTNDSYEEQKSSYSNGLVLFKRSYFSNDGLEVGIYSQKLSEAKFLNTFYKTSPAGSYTHSRVSDRLPEFEREIEQIIRATEKVDAAK